MRKIIAAAHGAVPADFVAPLDQIQESDWAPARDSLARFVKATKSNDFAKLALKKGLSQGRVSAIAKLFVTEPDLGNIPTNSRREGRLLTISEKQKLVAIEPSFWFSRIDLQRVSYNWSRGVFANIAQSNSFVESDGVLLSVPGQRAIAYKVMFLKKDVLKLISQWKRKYPGLIQTEDSLTKPRTKYDWATHLDSLIKYALRGKLLFHDGIVSRGEREAQAQIEEEVGSRTKCGESSARRRAKDLISIDEAAKHSPEHLEKTVMDLRGPLGPVIRLALANHS